MGMQAMELSKGETLVGMSILPASVTSDKAEAKVTTPSPTPTVLLVTSQGLGKRVPIEAFKLQHRAGKGNIAIKCNPGDRLIALHVVLPLCCCVSCIM